MGWEMSVFSIAENLIHPKKGTGAHTGVHVSNGLNFISKKFS